MLAWMRQQTAVSVLARHRHLHAVSWKPAVQELAPHTAPLFVAAVRLLPAGVVLVAWAAAQGRPQPQGRAAWAGISAFALADGACFQARLNVQASSAGALLDRVSVNRVRCAAPGLGQSSKSGASRLVTSTEATHVNVCVWQIAMQPSRNDVYF